MIERTLAQSVRALTACTVGAACAASHAGAASDFALHLDGETGEVISEANFDVEQITLEAWVNVETVNLHPCCTFAGLLTWGRGADASWEFAIVGQPAGGPLTHLYPSFKINWQKEGQNTLHSSDAHFDLEEWVHLAATYDGTTVLMYIDGELVDEAVFDEPISTGGDGAYMSIGNNFPGADEYLGGTVDELRIWNVVRTQQQIQNTMRRPLLGTEPGLLAYYNLNEGEGDVVNDASGNERHGVIVGGHDSGGANWVASTSPVDFAIGDLNQNGVVDVTDLLLLLGEWGECAECPADLNGDGVVNVTDLLLLLANWGSTTPR